jgi:hypothetical protein
MPIYVSVAVRRSGVLQKTAGGIGAGGIAPRDKTIPPKNTPSAPSLESTVQENQAPASATFRRQSAESNRGTRFGFEMANEG